MIIRFPTFCVRLLSVLVLAASAMACAPKVRDLHLSQEIIDNMPREQALNFLQSLAPGGNMIEPYCLFEADGVRRWQWLPGRRGQQLLPNKYPYNAFRVQPIILGDIALYGSGLKHWCIINNMGNASQQGKELDRFTGKIVMALMSLGVRDNTYGRSGLRPREVTTAPKN